jgi:hypothetical protein
MTKTDLSEVRSEMKEFKTEIQSDMKELKTEIQSEMKHLKNELQSEMKDLRTELKADIKAVEHTLTIRMGVMLGAGIGLITALTTFIKH